MAGDKKAYEKAIRTGLNFAWEANWEKALGAYQKALEEMPDDPVVHSHLGLAYLELENFDAALGSYGQASKLAPDDPAPLTRLAEIHAKLGQRHAAADAFYSLAKLHQRRRAWTQAIQALQQTIPPVFQCICSERVGIRTRLHRLGSGLHNVDLAVFPVLGTFNIHGPAIMGLNAACSARQFEDFTIRKHEVLPLSVRSWDIAGWAVTLTAIDHFELFCAQCLVNDRGQVFVAEKGFVHLVFVGIHVALDDVFAKPPRRVDQDDFVKTAFGIDGEHDP